MAYDKSPTKDHVIFGTAVFTVAFLVVLIPFFNSYWDSMRTGEFYGKIEGRENTELEAYRKAQAAYGEGSVLSIEDAKKQLASGRLSSAEIRPQLSDRPDLEAVQGWVLNPNEAGAAAALEAYENAAREAAAREAAARAAAEDSTEAGAEAPAEGEASQNTITPIQ